MRRLMTGPEALRPEGNHFDLLRLVLAVTVIASHSYLAVEGSTHVEPMHLLSEGRYTVGGLAVAAFIALSGFLVAESWHRSRSAWDFLRRRLCRIYPAYVVCFALSVLVAVTWGGGVFRREGVAVIAVDLVVRAMVLSPGIPVDRAFASLPGAGMINVSLWTICVEFALYFLLLVMGLLGLVSPRLPAWRVGVVAGLFVASVAFRWVFLPVGQYHDHGVSQLFVFPPSWAGLAPYFLAGVLAWALRDRLARSWWLVGGLLGAQAVVFEWHKLFDALLPVTMMYTLLVVGFSRGGLPRLPRWMGDVSYGTYLYGFLLQQVLLTLMPRSWWNPWALTALAVPLTMLVALLSWHCVEKWFLSRARRSATTTHAIDQAARSASAPVVSEGRPAGATAGEEGLAPTGRPVPTVSVTVRTPPPNVRVKPSNVWVWAIGRSKPETDGPSEQPISVDQRKS